MAADTAELTKIDSAVSGLSSSPTSPMDDKKMQHRRTSSSVSGVYNINDLGKSLLFFKFFLVCISSWLP